MKIFWIALLITSIYFGYKTGMLYIGQYGQEDFIQVLKFGIYSFVAGVSFSALIYEFLCSSASISLNAYKRELEKESIDKTESSSRIKVLESKIEVLEKALNNALNK